LYKEINIYKYFKFFVKENYQENYQGRNNPGGYPANYCPTKTPSPVLEEWVLLGLSRT
jgi:hypothetical protein